MAYDVIQESDKNRFIINFDGKLSTLDYGINDGKMLFFSTHVHPEQEGKGIASALTERALAYAIENNLKIVPLCAFTKAYILRHNDKYKGHLNND